MLGTSFVLCGIQSTIKKYVALLIVACANRVFIIKHRRRKVTGFKEHAGPYKELYTIFFQYGDSDGGTGSSSTVKFVRKVPGQKTLDSFVKRMSKKVGEPTRMLIREWTATLVAAAQLPYRFIEQEPLKEFAQAFIDSGAVYRRVPASDFIVGCHTVRSDIVQKVQETFRELIAAPSKSGAVSFVSDLWLDNVVQHSYLDVTFF